MRRALQASAAVGLVLLVALLALPLAGLVTRIAPATLVARLREPVVLDALRLSLLTSVASTAVVVLLGLPVAYLLATRDFPMKRLVELLVDLPMVLPPTVAGVGLLTAFGRAGLAGGASRGSGSRSRSPRWASSSPRPSSRRPSSSGPPGRA